MKGRSGRSAAGAPRPVAARRGRGPRGGHGTRPGRNARAAFLPLRAVAVAAGAQGPDHRAAAALGRRRSAASAAAADCRPAAAIQPVHGPRTGGRRTRFSGRSKRCIRRHRKRRRSWPGRARAASRRRSRRTACPRPTRPLSRSCAASANWRNRRYAQATAWFQVALKSASDFLGAAFYIGACHAASGRDQEAVGAWQLSLLSEAADVVYPPLVDGLLRLGDGLNALTFIDEAPDAWKDDETRDERQATAEAMTGAYVPALEKLHAPHRAAPGRHGPDLPRPAGDVPGSPGDGLAHRRRSRSLRRYTPPAIPRQRARRPRWSAAGSGTWKSPSHVVNDRRQSRLTTGCSRRAETRRRRENRRAAGGVAPPERVDVPAQRRLRRDDLHALRTRPRPSRGMTAAPSPAPTSASCVAYSDAVCATAARGPGAAACASASRGRSILRAR